MEVDLNPKAGGEETGGYCPLLHTHLCPLSFEEKLKRIQELCKVLSQTEKLEEAEIGLLSKVIDMAKTRLAAHEESLSGTS